MDAKWVTGWVSALHATRHEVSSISSPSPKLQPSAAECFQGFLLVYNHTNKGKKKKHRGDVPSDDASLKKTDSVRSDACHRAPPTRCHRSGASFRGRSPGQSSAGLMHATSRRCSVGSTSFNAKVTCKIQQQVEKFTIQSKRMNVVVVT